MTQTLEDGQAEQQAGQSDIGVVGLAVMGENLILNMASKGFTVSAFNRTVSKVSDFVEGRAKGQGLLGGRTATGGNHDGGNHYADRDN